MFLRENVENVPEPPSNVWFVQSKFLSGKHEKDFKELRVNIYTYINILGIKNEEFIFCIKFCLVIIQIKEF